MARTHKNRLIFVFLCFLIISTPHCSGCTDSDSTSRADPNSDATSDADGPAPKDATNCEEALRGCLQPAEWVQDSTPIREYCFESAQQQVRTRVQVYGNNGKLGEVAIEQVDGDGESAPNGTVITEYEPQQGEKLKLYFRGQTANEGYRVDMRPEKTINPLK